VPPPPPQSAEAQGETSITVLETGRPVGREISGGQTQSYRMTSPAGQFVSVRVEQRGVDVAAEVFAPDGKLIAQFDSEARPQEAERAEFVAETAGAYRLDVKAKFRGAAGGYEIRVAEARAATEQDRLSHEARRLSAESANLRDAGKFDEALPLAARALEAGEKALGADHGYVAFLLNQLGYLQREKGEYAKAEAYYRRATVIGEKALGGEHPQTVDSISGLGRVYVSKDDFGKAGRLLQRALEITERTLGAEHPRVVELLINLESLHIKLGDLAHSERDLQRALTIAEKTLEPHDPLTARVLNNLGYLCLLKKDYERGETFLQRAVAIREKALGPEHPDLHYPLLNLGRIARERKDYARALEMYRRALTISEKTLGPEHIDVATLLNNIANVYKAQGDYAKPLEVYRRVLDIAEKRGGPYHGFTIVVLGNLARTYAATGDIGNAVAFQTRVDERLETALAFNLAIGSERQKLAYFDSLAERTDRTISLHVGLAPGDRAAGALAALVLLQRKGRILDAMSDSLTALRQRSGAGDQRLLDQLNTITAQLAKLALNGPQKMDADEYRKQLTALEGQKEKLEAEISRRSAEFRAQSRPVTLSSVQAAIPPGAALIEFAVYRPFDARVELNSEAYGKPRYVAYVLRGQGDVQWKELGEAQAIDAEVDKLRQSLRDPLRGDVRDLARAVDEKVMRPVRALVGDAKQLLISPDGELNLIPFAALVDEQGRYLIERYSVSYLTSGRDLLRMQVKRESRSRPVVLADPDFGDPPVVASRVGAGGRVEIDYSRVFFGPLPGVGHEVRALKGLLPQATFLTGGQATKAALKRVGAPSILHIATHGFFLPNGGRAGGGGAAQAKDATRLGKGGDRVENPLLRSGLALAGANRGPGVEDDGVLTAFEMAHLDLWGTKLVVLSACDTGVGEVKAGEGVYGLRRALVLAGAESQMVSLWPVSDRSTRELMASYYEGLTRNEGRGEALRRAQLKLLRGGKHSHPYYWASFIQTGEWANLKGER
jgi:CHAT domain-containing protein/Tfp pilus assembly protein PilF